MEYYIQRIWLEYFILSFCFVLFNSFFLFFYCIILWFNRRKYFFISWVALSLKCLSYNVGKFNIPFFQYLLLTVTVYYIDKHKSLPTVYYTIWEWNSYERVIKENLIWEYVAYKHAVYKRVVAKNYRINNELKNKCGRDRIDYLSLSEKIRLGQSCKSTNR